MTDSPLSDSEGRVAFDRLHPKVQRWVYRQGWKGLRDAQARAVAPILAGERDVIISAATAAGKTEAAFLPICSRLVAERASGGARRGVEVLCISPLKALINDQFDRLEQLCEDLDVPVHRWHGDVSMSAKQRVLKSPSGVLFITPESMEATFVRRGEMVRDLYQQARYVVIDELHSFLGVPRGVQVQSQLNRLELAIRRRVPRIGLSATLGDRALGARFLRPGDPSSVTVITSTEPAREPIIDVRGYVRSELDPEPDNRSAPPPAPDEIVGHLFGVLRGSTNLVFGNSRTQVEAYSDALRRRCEELGVPEEFFAHHGSLSKEQREWVEGALKAPNRPSTAVCTSTLEMGIDIGAVDTVAQLGSPPSVASLKQRVGRSGRRDTQSRLLVCVEEDELTAQSALAQELRVELVEAVAMIELMLEAWVEPGNDPGYNYSTLVHQVLSTIAQHGGARADQLHRALCGPGPFALVDPNRFAQLLRAMAAAKLLRQSTDGTLLPDTDGERHLARHSFYPVFLTTLEWRLVAGGKTVGTMPIAQPLVVDDFLIFAGRRWVIRSIDDNAHLVELEPATGGRVPKFNGSGGPQVADRVRQTMARLYAGGTTPAWVDPVAGSLLSEARAAWRARGMATEPLRQVGADAEIWPWVGDRTLLTVALALRSTGLAASKPFMAPNLLIEKASPDDVTRAAQHLLAAETPTAAQLARSVANPRTEKWDWVLPDELVWEAEGARHLDVEAAWDLLRRVAAGQWTVTA